MGVPTISRRNLYCRDGASCNGKAKRAATPDAQETCCHETSYTQETCYDETFDAQETCCDESSCCYMKKPILAAKCFASKKPTARRKPPMKRKILRGRLRHSKTLSVLRWRKESQVILLDIIILLHCYLSPMHMHN